jgi:hypothetical protein
MGDRKMKRGIFDLVVILLFSLMVTVNGVEVINSIQSTTEIKGGVGGH